LLLTEFCSHRGLVPQIETDLIVLHVAATAAKLADKISQRGHAHWGINE
jgi:hypothetical protein